MDHSADNSENYLPITYSLLLTDEKYDSHNGGQPCAGTGICADDR